MSAHLAHIGGEGPPLVLIHGFGANRLFFQALVASLPAARAFHAVELPGHGDAGPLGADASPAGLADAVAGALAPLPAPLPVLGHSLGGAVALALAERHPGLVSQLILIAPSGWGAGLDAEFLRAVPELTDGVEAQALMERLVVRPRHIPPGLGAHVVAELTPQRRADLARIAEAALAAPVPEAPDVPITLIWGDADRVVPRDPARTHPAQVTAHVVTGTGHMPHVEKASATARIVADALT